MARSKTNQPEASSEVKIQEGKRRREEAVHSLGLKHSGIGLSLF